MLFTLGTPPVVMNKLITDCALDITKLTANLKDIGVRTGLQSKIRKGFILMTAADWKEWVLELSSYCLRDAVASDVFTMWLDYVAACQLLTQRYVVLKFWNKHASYKTLITLV